MNARGINRGKSGNVSARCRTAAFDGFFVTPTALPYDETGPDDIVPMTLDGSGAAGSRLPSSEWRFHRDIYRARPDANAVVHTHAPFATTLACHSSRHSRVPLHGRCGRRPRHPLRALRDVRHAGAVRPRGRGARRTQRMPLAHHGMIAVGASLPEALALAVEVETLAEIYWRALAIGEPAMLDRRRDGRRARQVQDLRPTAAR